MHSWGDEGVDWEGINDAARFIARTISLFGRVSVFDYKEKFGTARVYCSFGWSGLYSIWRPTHCWYPKWWPTKLDFWIGQTRPFLKLVDFILPLQYKLYAYAYKIAVHRWPHLYNEIVSMADHGELLEGTVPGYIHSNYWTKG